MLTLFAKLLLYCDEIKNKIKNKTAFDLVSFLDLGTVICASRIYGICVITSVSFCANKIGLAEDINAAHTSLACSQ